MYIPDQECVQNNYDVLKVNDLEKKKVDKLRLRFTFHCPTMRKFYPDTDNLFSDGNADVVVKWSIPTVLSPFRHGVDPYSSHKENS